jgi:ribonuclease PH
MARKDGRLFDQMRPIALRYDICHYPAGSVLIEQGRTKVLCSVSMQPTVPPFLRGKKMGWLTAEYSMLPTATHIRKEREQFASRPNGRTMEISRLIGRSLRTILDLAAIGERTITIDCDVIQADGSTRTASITGAYVALRIAVDRWLRNGILQQEIIKEGIAAVSIGMYREQLLLDLDCGEDSMIDADFNFVLTESGNIIEVQGCAERLPVSWPVLQEMYFLAQKGVDEIFALLGDLQRPPFSHQRSSAQFRSQFVPARSAKQVPFMMHDEEEQAPL